MFFFFNDTATTEIYTLSLHDALPICRHRLHFFLVLDFLSRQVRFKAAAAARFIHSFSADYYQLFAGDQALRMLRSEEHTSELQSRLHIVCRLLLENKNHVGIENHREN